MQVYIKSPGFLVETQIAEHNPITNFVHTSEGEAQNVALLTNSQ